MSAVVLTSLWCALAYDRLHSDWGPTRPSRTALEHLAGWCFLTATCGTPLLLLLVRRRRRRGGGLLLVAAGVALLAILVAGLGIDRHALTVCTCDSG